MSLLYLPFVIQSLLMGLDEGLHMKRGLGKWERLGHPLDTLTVLLPLSFIAVTDFSESKLITFIILSAFSCLFITKDEFIHSRECSAFEQWLHSLLFILHPMIFFCSALIWKYSSGNEFLILQPLLIGSFMIYQILRWSLYGISK